MIRVPELRFARWSVLFIGAFVATGSSQRPDVHTIVSKSVQANERDWTASPDYSYKERDKVASGTKTYQVMMIEGTPYRELIAVNGEPLSASQRAQQQQKLQQVTAQRKAESPEQRQQRIQKYQRELKRDHTLMQQLTIAFDFKLVGQRMVNGRDTWLLKATPKPSYKPPSMETEVLTGMQGQMWIDQATYHWVKVTAQVMHPVSIEGFLAQVEPGTRFELEKTPVDDDIWQTSHFAMRSHAKVLYLFNHSSSEEEWYFDYKRFRNPSENGTPSHASQAGLGMPSPYVGWE